MKERREKKWSRNFSSANYLKGLIEEVVPPIVDQIVLTTGASLDDSLSSWSSLEMEELAPPPPPPPGGVMNYTLLKRKIQTGVQDRVNEFWKEKVGHYIMQGDYISLIMEEGSCVTWRSYLIKSVQRQHFYHLFLFLRLDMSLPGRIPRY